MPARFSKYQPWDFGYSPSQYYAALSQGQMARAYFENIGIGDMDLLHAFACRTPQTRKLVLKELLDTALAAGESNILISCLVASYCKPMGEIDIPEHFAQRIAELMEDNNIKIRQRISTTRNGYIHMEMSWSEELLERAAEYDNIDQKGKLSKKERKLAEGILFGYPIGEAFAHAFEYNGDYNLLKLPKGLFFTSYPGGWSEKWRSEVGDKALKHLDMVYAQSISDWTSMEGSPLSVLF